MPAARRRRRRGRAAASSSTPSCPRPRGGSRAAAGNMPRAREAPAPSSSARWASWSPLRRSSPPAPSPCPPLRSPSTAPRSAGPRSTATWPRSQQNQAFDCYLDASVAVRSGSTAGLPRRRRHRRQRHLQHRLRRLLAEQLDQQPARRAPRGDPAPGRRRRRAGSAGRADLVGSISGTLGSGGRGQRPERGVRAERPGDHRHAARRHGRPSSSRPRRPATSCSPTRPATGSTTDELARYFAATPASSGRSAWRHPDAEPRRGDARPGGDRGRPSFASVAKAVLDRHDQRGQRGRARLLHGQRRRRTDGGQRRRRGSRSGSSASRSPTTARTCSSRSRATQPADFDAASPAVRQARARGRLHQGGPAARRARPGRAQVSVDPRYGRWSGARRRRHRPPARPGVGATFLNPRHDARRRPAATPRVDGRRARPRRARAPGRGRPAGRSSAPRRLPAHRRATRRPPALPDAGLLRPPLRERRHLRGGLPPHRRGPRRRRGGGRARRRVLYGVPGLPAGRRGDGRAAARRPAGRGRGRPGPVVPRPGLGRPRSRPGRRRASRSSTAPASRSRRPGDPGPFLVAQCWSPDVLSGVKLAARRRRRTAPARDRARTTSAWPTSGRRGGLARARPGGRARPPHLACGSPRLAAPVAPAHGRRSRSWSGRCASACPWDRAQTHALAHPPPDRGDLRGARRDRRGDRRADGTGRPALDARRPPGGGARRPAFQVFFHARLAAEEGWFTLADVARGVHDKLVGRHPHVFGDVTRDDAGRGAWPTGRPSRRPRRAGARASTDGIPTALPALLLRGQVQRKAAGGRVRRARRGRAWPKIDEELAELAGGSGAARRARRIGWATSCVALVNVGPARSASIAEEAARARRRRAKCAPGSQAHGAAGGRSCGRHATRGRTRSRSGAHWVAPVAGGPTRVAWSRPAASPADGAKERHA